MTEDDLQFYKEQIRAHRRNSPYGEGTPLPFLYLKDAVEEIERCWKQIAELTSSLPEKGNPSTIREAGPAPRKDTLLSRWPNAYEASSDVSPLKLTIGPGFRRDGMRIQSAAHEIGSLLSFIHEPLCHIEAVVTLRVDGQEEAFDIEVVDVTKDILEMACLPPYELVSTMLDIAKSTRLPSGGHCSKARFHFHKDDAFWVEGYSGFS